MKRIWLTPVILCLASSAAFAQPANTVLGEIAVGKDNVTRVVWGDTNGAVQLETVQSNGTVNAVGNPIGPFSGWYLGQPAVGPNNDSILSWITSSSNEFSIMHLNSSDNWVNSTIVNISNPINGAGLEATAMDSSDNAWMFDEYLDQNRNPPPGEYTGQTYGYNSTTGAVAGGATALTSGAFFDSFAIRNDGTPLLLSQGDTSGNLSYTYVSYPIPQVHSFGTLLGQAPMSSPSGGWSTDKITTTPNNHAQIYWIGPDDSLGSFNWALMIWDIAPNGTVTASPEYLFNNWVPQSEAASPFTGGDGQLRVTWYNIATAQYDLMTISPAAWPSGQGISNSVFL